ncbi:MAG: dihydrodipicolinate synthase family protein [Acidilobus sp.]
MARKIEGVVVPLVTPFRQDGSLDVDSFQWLCRRLVSAGVTGLFPNSTTGEFVHLTVEEAERLVKAAVTAAPADVMVLPGVSSNRTEDSVNMARRFVDLGADGVIVLPPFFFRGGEEIIYRHISEVAKAVDVPVVVYNNPINTGVVIPVSLYVRLAQEFSNVMAAKVTYADFSYLVELIREVKAARKDFSVLTGLDYMELATLELGGDGVVGALANIAPEVHVGLYRAWDSGNYQDALRYHNVLLELSRLYWYRASGAESPALIKGVLEGLGTPVRRFVRAPLRPLTDQEVSDVTNIASAALSQLSRQS